MSTPVTLPPLGESITEGTVTQWLKKEGDTVDVDEPLLEVSTDKVDTEIPSPTSGVLTRIIVSEDETVEVGAEIAVISEAGEAGAAAPAAEPAQATPEPTPEPAPEPAAARPAPAEPAQPTQPAPSAQPAQPAPSAQPTQPTQPAEPAQPAAAAAEQAERVSPAPSRRTREDVTPSVDVGTVNAGAARDAASESYLTPLVRKLAAERGVDLSTVTGTGVGGRIRKQDVLAAAERQASRAAAPAPSHVVTPDTTLRGRTEKMSALRQSIAQRMVESQHTSAQASQVIEVDVTRIARLRELASSEFQARAGVPLTYFPFFTLATVEALKGHPKLNAVIDSAAQQVTYHAEENLAIAIDTEQGLLAPVIQEAGNLNLAGLAKAIFDLASRTRSGDVSPDELSGATFSLNNTGSVGAVLDTPIINQPQVAILSVGKVTKRPVVVDDPNLGEVIAVRSMVFLSLSFDHRLIDGGDAARFLQDIRARLEEGAFEAEVGLA